MQLSFSNAGGCDEATHLKCDDAVNGFVGSIHWPCTHVPMPMPVDSSPSGPPRQTVAVGRPLCHTQPAHMNDNEGKMTSVAKYQC